MIIQLQFTDEDVTFDAMDALKNFKTQNIHPEHSGDIDKVTYRKEGLDKIILSGEDEAALDYVADYASETDLDRFRGKTKVKLPPPPQPAEPLRCPYCGGEDISTDANGHTCMGCYGEF
jgi:hypothetical protein